MIDNLQLETPRPSDLWCELLEMQLMMLKYNLSETLKGVIQFKVNSTEAGHSFYIKLSASESQLLQGEAELSAVDTIIETNQMQISKVMFKGIESLLDMNISGDSQLLKDYVVYASKLKANLA